MARHLINTYAMLTLERWLEILPEIQARCPACISAALSPDSPEQEASEEEEEAQQAPDTDMEDTEPEEEEVEQQAPDADVEDTESEKEGEADPTPPAAGFSMGDALIVFEVAQAEEAGE